MPKLGQRSPGCTIPIQMIEEHFEKRMVGDNTEFSPDPDLLKDFAPQDGAQLEEPISSNAVWYRLLKMGNTAPGPDGISYQELKRVDPNATILTQIFQMRAVPPSWKESSSILVHKKGDAEDLGNWRPITLGNTIAKLYTAVLADKLRRWAATTGQLSKAGLHGVRGSAIEETKRTSRQACFAWLDLENAFGSVPHENLFNVLDAFSIPKKIRTLLGTTLPIPFKRGVKQGCPGSPTLFNVAIEVIVCTLASMAKDHGVCLLGHYVSVLAYADDLLIMVKDKESLQAPLDTTGDLAGKIGLHFKGPKCATLHLDCRKKRTTLTRTFCIQEQPISAMREEDTYCHLGVPTGFIKTRNPEEAIKGINEDAEKIHSSLLAPWQKIDATKTFVYTRLDFILRGSPIHKTFREVDLLMKRLGKKWPGLPLQASNEVLFIPPSKGGAGIHFYTTLSHIYINFERVCYGMITVEKRAQKSAPSKRIKKKTPRSDSTALEESKHSTQPAAQEPISSETPTGLPVELDQQNTPAPCENTPLQHPSLHSRQSPLVQQEEATDNLRLPVVNSDPPNVQTPQVLDSVDLQAAAPPDDPAHLPQDTPVTPPPASQPVDELQQRPP
ncbi:hypothetical protein LAZ67_1008342 [Cordylochernes scorpioides]|uniref:Reverse transcriptase domain-containing protein n=1 Tax=Cordylochernes scorpioides TaxID=51811 RepID=A0ABY6K120_9ARAC|nr:hypothetical protein LAZ67_1008342 [Cordylochernes scorpioides]